MFSLANHRFLPLGAGLALAAACGANEFQLEPIHAALGIEDAVVEAWGDDATCVALAGVALDGPVSQATYEPRLNGRPIQISGSTLTAMKGIVSFFCARSGEYDLSLHKDGNSVAHTGTLSMRPGQQLYVLIHGDAGAPIMTAAEVDLSDPGAGLRRMRITNLIPDGQPVQLIYYDEADVELGRSAAIAHGDTWTGTISTTVTSWRFEPTQELALPIYSGLNTSALWNRICTESRTAGLILTGRVYPDDETSVIPEYYNQPPPECTVDEELCPSCASGLPWR